MPKLKKGNTYGVKPNCVPYYKGVKREKVKKNSPAQYVRLSAELDEMNTIRETENTLVARQLPPLAARGLKRKSTNEYPDNPHL